MLFRVYLPLIHARQMIHYTTRTYIINKYQARRLYKYTFTDISWEKYPLPVPGFELATFGLKSSCQGINFLSAITFFQINNLFSHQVKHLEIKWSFFKCPVDLSASTFYRTNPSLWSRLPPFPDVSVDVAANDADDDDDVATIDN